MAKGADERRDEMTPGQQRARFLSGGVGSEESLRRDLAGSPDGGEHGETIGNASAYVERELTDEEIVSEIQRLRAGVMDGSVPVFFDGESARHYWSERFGE